MVYKPVAFGFETPNIPLGWGGQYYPSSFLSGFMYDLSTQNLYTIYPQQQYDVWLNTPTSLAQQLTIAGKQNSSQQGYPDPGSIYVQSIKGVFPQCILTENGAPLLCENGNYLVLTQGTTIQ